MIRTWQLILADALLTFLSVIIGLMLRLEIIYVGYFLRAIWPFIVLAVLLRPAVFYVSGVYRRIWRYASARDYLSIALSVLVGTLILSLVTLVWLYPDWMATFPRSLLLIEGLLTLFLLVGFRITLQITERYPGDINWKTIELPAPQRTLIIGAGAAGTQMMDELLSNPQLGLKPAAFLDDDPNKIDRKIHGLTVFGPLIRLAEVVEHQKIAEVVIAIPSAPAQTIQNIKSDCEQLEISYSAMPSLSSFLNEPSSGATGYRVPMAMPDITGEEIQAVVRVMQSRNLSIGSQTLALERLAADVAEASYGVAVTNGTSALHMCMLAAGVGPGDEVITSPYSFIASANCILYAGATPVFVDVDPVTLNIDPSQLEVAITERTRAIIPVHIFGQPADLDPIFEIAERYNLIIIEDSAEAVGAAYKGRPVGALGKAGIFAFYPNKQMTSGEGAVIVTNDEAWADLFRSLRNQGRDKFDEWLNHSRLGYNYRMSELNAAVGVVQMRRLDELLDKRQAVADRYSKLIAELEGVSPLKVVPNTSRMSWFVYVVRFAPNINRNQVMAHLSKKGIPTRPYFSPIHLQPFYSDQFGFKEGDFPEAEAAGGSTLALPFHTNMNSDEIRLVVEALKEAAESSLN
ncbi:MAG: DegT/DnrJ/EryC1/StrS family aminotransferase [Anaerolineales bacterium]|nr:DegT/DnrJ/EryC1/StrS family aminotransferase [Anaerolineales bacterium]